MFSAALVKIGLTRYVVSSWESNTWHSSMCIHFPFFGKLPFTDFDWWDLIETWILWNSAPYKQMVDKQIRKWLTMWLNLRISIDTMSLACRRPSRAAGGYNCPSSYHTLLTTTKRVQPHLQKEVALVEEINTFMAWWAGCAQASSRPVRSMWDPPERLASWRTALIPPFVTDEITLCLNDFHWWHLTSVKLGPFQMRTVLIQTVVEQRGIEWICDKT